MTTPTTFSYLHSHWTPCEFYSVDFCWALPLTRNGQRPVLVKEWTHEGQTKQGEGSEWNRNVDWKETCRGRDGKCFFISVFTSGRSPCLNFCGFWIVLPSVCCQALVFWREQVWTAGFEGYWMFVFRLVGRTRGRKNKRRETEPKKSCSIVDEHVLPAACSHRLRIHLVHCVFSTTTKKKVHWDALKSKVVNRWLMSIL